MTQKYIYKTDFADLSQSLQEKLIDSLIEKRYMRGDYDYLYYDENYPTKIVEEAKRNLRLRDEIQMEFEVKIVVEF